MFTNEEIKQIEERGSSLETVMAQVEKFKKGFPWMKIIGPATPEMGIAVLDDKEADAACEYYDKAVIDGKCKFVPASGAASRMFKDIFAGLSKLGKGEDVANDSAVAELARRIESFAFYSERIFGKPEDTMEYRRNAASMLLGENGLAYGAKPKGVLAFHRYPDGEVRTAFAEHLVEAQKYMKNSDGSANIVFTVSPEHRPLFEEALADVKEKFEKRYGVEYKVSFTYQDKATDTIAVDEENRPFRTDDGSLLFRPGGHGALIYNLNRVDEELVSIKNIDNVANERLLPVTERYKKVLLGKCTELRDKIFGYLKALDEQTSTDSGECRMLCDRIEAFLDKELCVRLPHASDNKSRVRLLRAKLDRPIRVCGMVRNQGEPGGGPFIIQNNDGSSGLQILESVQLDMADPVSAEMLSRATHFNPVDLVCCLRDYKGRKFDLLSYIDEDAGFISSKSYMGRNLKALELPGLWNGAMSDWNTLFVEVPVETFNPVKVVLDLLRPAHQSE